MTTEATKELNDLFTDFLGKAPKKDVIAPAIFEIELPSGEVVPLANFMARLQKNAFTHAKKFDDQESYNEAVEVMLRKGIEYMQKNKNTRIDTDYRQTVIDAANE